MMKFKKSISLLLAFLILCSCSVCFASAAIRVKIGTAYISFEDKGVRPTGESGLAYPMPLGTIFSRSAITIYSDDTPATVTKRFLESRGGSCTYTGAPEKNGAFALTAICNITAESGQRLTSFGKGDCGAQSGWLLGFNECFSTQSPSDLVLSDGDVLQWVYSCSTGADIGADFSNPSAEIIGLILSSGTLSPAFDPAVETYTLKIPQNKTSLRVKPVLENYTSVVTVKCTHDKMTKTYKYNSAISVSNGDVITITSKCGNLQDTVKLKISQSNPTAANGIRAFFAAFIDSIRKFFQSLFKNG